MFKKNDFNPRFIELFLNSNYLERKELWNNIRKIAPDYTGDILDLGCGTKPYEKLFINLDKYIGLEINGGGINCADIFYDGNIFPFEDTEFDTMVSFQVIYQIPNLEHTLQEINRVLKKDGKLLVTVPFIWLDGGENIHRRFSEQYSKFIFNKFGFKVDKIIQTNSNMSALCLLANKYTQYKISKIKINIFRKMIRIFEIFLLTPFLNILGLLFLRFQNKDNELYIDSIIMATKVKSV